MRETDDAAIELQLRRVLTARLGPLPIDLTADDLERRRVVRDHVRRRRRIVLGLGLAAAVILPAGWLAAGALVPRPATPVVAIVAPDPSPRSTGLTPSPSAASDPVRPTLEKLGRSTTGQLSRFGSALLADGRVLLVGGVDTTIGQETVAAAWLFDPATKLILPTVAMSTPRADPHLVTLPDGRVLVFGGWREDPATGEQSSLSTAELYDPATGTFAPTADLPHARRDCPCGALNSLPWAIQRATVLLDDRVFVAGGGGDASVGGGTSGFTADVFDPAAERWSQLSIGCDAARGGQALLRDGHLLIVCVDDHGDVRARLFDPETDTFSEGAKPPAADSVATTLPDGRVLLTGREPAVYDPTADSFRLLPAGPRPAGQAGIVIGLGRVLFLGDATVVFDPGSETFTQGGQIGIADADAVVPLRDGRILIVGYQLEAALLDPRAVP